jgi:hypothetical protein
MSSTLYTWRVVGFLYTESCRHFCNLTNIRRKPSACFSLHVGMVPKAYHHIEILIVSAKDLNIREKYIKTAESWSISLLYCIDVKDSIDRHCMCHISMLLCSLIDPECEHSFHRSHS